MSPVGAHQRPGFLPEVCDPEAATYSAGTGTGDPVKEAVLVSCAAMYEDGDTAAQHPGCDWFTRRPRLAVPRPERDQRRFDRVAERFKRHGRLRPNSSAPRRVERRCRQSVGLFCGPPRSRRRASLVAGAVRGLRDRGGGLAQPTGTRAGHRRRIDPSRVGGLSSPSAATGTSGTKAERLATIADIRAQVNQAGADGPTPDLTDGDAYALFERACANDYALGFRLYKLYLRAASFGALSE